MRAFFRRWWLGLDPCLGITIQGGHILASGNGDVLNGGARAKHLSAPIPPGALEHGVVKKPREFGAAIKEMLLQSSARYLRCAIALPSEATFVHALSVSEEIRHWPNDALVAWALKELHFDDLDLIVRIYGEEGERKRLFVAVKRTVIDAYRDAIATTSLDLDIITLRAHALAHGLSSLHRHSSAGRELVLDLTERAFFLHLFDKGRLCQSRGVFDPGTVGSEIMATIAGGDALGETVINGAASSSTRVVIYAEPHQASLCRRVVDELHTLSSGMHVAIDLSSSLSTIERETLITNGVASLGGW